MGKAQYLLPLCMRCSKSSNLIIISSCRTNAQPVIRYINAHKNSKMAMTNHSQIPISASHTRLHQRKKWDNTVRHVPYRPTMCLLTNTAQEQQKNGTTQSAMCPTDQPRRHALTLCMQCCEGLELCIAHIGPGRILVDNTDNGVLPITHMHCNQEYAIIAGTIVKMNMISLIPQ